jgi:hypothetical protein
MKPSLQRKFFDIVIPHLSDIFIEFKKEYAEKIVNCK